MARSLEVSPEKTVEIVKSRIVDRPKNAVRISCEIFEGSEHQSIIDLRANRASMVFLKGFLRRGRRLFLGMASLFRFL